jgi:hypothetical protein
VAEKGRSLCSALRTMLQRRDALESERKLLESTKYARSPPRARTIADRFWCRDQLRRTLSAVDFLRWRLVEELRQIYNIQQNNQVFLLVALLCSLVEFQDGDVIFSIANLKLPNSDFTGIDAMQVRSNARIGSDEEEVAAALGYVAHVLALLSRWFQVRWFWRPCPHRSLNTPLQMPLRYPLLLLGSRSQVGFSYRCFLKFLADHR